LLGVGRIGAEVAKRAKAFGMKIIYYDVVRRQDLENSLGMRFVHFDELLSESDVLSIHTPLTPQTHHVIDAKALSKMKKTAIIVNTARGPIIDEKALADALKKGEIAGAALDVFSEEPLTSSHVFHQLGESLPNLIITPHHGIGMYTVRAMIRGAAEEVVTVLSGGEPRYAVNKIVKTRA
jgi:phosphoglycerate dehydrogenase-like enzyme